MLLPLAVFIAAAWLLISQSRAISSVRERISLVRQQISASAGNDSPPSLPDESSATRNRTSGKSSVNWLRIAKITGEQGGGIFAKQEMLRAKARIREMGKDELLTTLSEIKTLGLDIRSRGQIEGLLIAALGKEDPAAALSYLIVPGNDHAGIGGNLMTNILRDWTRRDMPGALAWFDGQIAAGNFETRSHDGINFRRARFEAALLANLMNTDPAAAAQRLSGYSVANRASIFQNICASGNAANENELAARVLLAREALPASGQATVIASSIARFAGQGDYEGIDRFLGRIAATPEERASSIAATGNKRFTNLCRDDKLTTGEIDSFRKWAFSYEPAKVDDITGRALASVAEYHEAKAKELLLHYQETSGSDDVVLGFLDSWPFWGNEAKARVLAAKIKDPERRDKFLKTLEADPFAR
ncbi:MAG: hypothetical protein V4819_08050 [Verrucomicrobiota bacterium]